MPQSNRRTQNRNTQLIRQWQIVQRLSASWPGVTLHDLAAAFGVTTRTIRRDLEALEEAGFPLVDLAPADDFEERRWRMFDWRKEVA